MSLFVVDVEADGPIPAEYSMVCFGAVRVDTNCDTTFYGQVCPISEHYIDEALAVSGITREQHLTFPGPVGVLQLFKAWIAQNNLKGRPVFVSDNLAFDWQFVNYYFHKYLGENPFGYSGRRIGDIYSGVVRDMYKANEWKHFRRTKHTHNPVDDAKGNAGALGAWDLEVCSFVQVLKHYRSSHFRGVLAAFLFVFGALRPKVIAMHSMVMLVFTA